MGESDIEYTRNIFPPFPPAPHGVVPIPFKEFKERGIYLVRNEYGQEIDGVGIPTVSLPLQDESDLDFEWPRQGRHFEQERRESNRKQWWQYWGEFDNRRPPFAVNPHQPRLDRILNALSSFRSSRHWPFERKNKQGPKYFWDQFRIFIGASGYPPVWNRTDKGKPTNETGLLSPDYSDDESDSPPKKPSEINVHISTKTEEKHCPGPARPPYAYYDITPVNLDSDEAVQALLELDKLGREEQLIDFLADPEKGIKVFLSSYSRDQSFLWSEDNLYIIPRLIQSFLKFVIKNRFFPGRPDEHRFQNALKFAESAHKELPFTSSISKFLPDEFGSACREYWGPQTKAQSFWSGGESDDDEASKSDSNSDDGSGVAVVSDVPGSIKSKITHISFDDETNDQAGLTGEYGTDGGSVPPPLQTHPTYASQPIPESFKSLLSAMNPFPVTHHARLAERSLRRIKRVLPPGGFGSSHTESRKAKTSSSCWGSIYIVEKDLDSMLTKIVLVPWVDSGLHGYTKPEMIDSIKVGQNATEVGKTLEDDHDPMEDDIVVLVSVASKNLDVLRDSIGMGLAGTWVQLMPVGEDEWDPRRSRYWYLDNLDAVVPSYWTPA